MFLVEVILDMTSMLGFYRNTCRDLYNKFYESRYYEWCYWQCFFRRFFGNFKQILAELEEDFGWVILKIAELGQDFVPVSPKLLGFCLKFPNFWVSCEKSAELASKFAWVRPKKSVWVRSSKSKKKHWLLGMIEWGSSFLSSCSNLD